AWPRRTGGAHEFAKSCRRHAAGYKTHRAYVHRESESPCVCDRASRADGSGRRGRHLPRRRFVALRAVGECLVICPVDSIAEADVRRESDEKFAEAVAQWRKVRT